MPAQTKEEQEEQAAAEKAEVEKALAQSAERDEEPTPEQENADSTDTIEVYAEVADDGVTEVWKWKRLTEDREDVDASEGEGFSSDNYATADAANAHPGVTTSVITSPPMREIEEEPEPKSKAKKEEEK